MDVYLALVAATLLLVLIPGPNVAIIVATSVARGTRYGLVAVAGTTVGLAAQLALTVSGLSALVEVAAISLEWLRWLGVAYLAYLGMRAWTTPAEDLQDDQPHETSGMTLFWSSAAVAAVNPKTLMFNAAFLPQFVVADGAVGTQFAVVAGVFLTVVAAGDSLWALLAGRTRAYLARFGRLRNRLTGCVYVGGAIALAFARRP
ncbi:MAG: LysE family translocator [Pseudomonadota bacterium]